MNIAILVPTLSVGGAERIAIETAKELVSLDDNVYLFVLSMKNNFFQEDNNIKVVHINGRFKLLNIYKLLRFYKIEKCICYLERANFLGLLSCLLAKVDYCATVHTAPKAAFGKRPLLNRIFIKITYSLISLLKRKVICVSKGIKKDLNSLYGIDNSVVIPNFIDSGIMLPEAKIKDNIEYNYIFVGRLEPVKGCDVFVDAFIKISEWVLANKIKIAIIGDGSEYYKIKQKVNNSNITNNIDFLGKLNDPSKVMIKSDTIIVSSYAEGFGLVVLESLAMGMKVIFSECDFGPKEIIEESFIEYKQLGFKNPSDDRDAAVNDLSEKIIASRKVERIPQNHIVTVLQEKYSRMVVCDKIKKFILS
ncbi:glycosyltransferase [Kluyvera ascorbata]